MARLSKNDALSRCRNRVQLSQRWREQEGYDATWQRMIDLYRGRHFPRSMTSEDRIAVNIAFSTVNVIYPSISVNHPKVTVEAQHPEAEDMAVIAEAVLNYWWKHYDVRSPFRLGVKDFLVVGHGWLKIGWRYREQEQPLDGAEYDDQYDEMSAQADEFAQQNPDLAHVVPTEDEIAAAIPETKVAVVEDRPFVERVSPFDMYVDPEATNMEDIGWIAQRVIRPLEDVRKDPRYKKGVRGDVQSDDVSKASAISQAAQRERREFGQDVERVIVWEYYDVKQNTMCVFANSGSGYLVDPRPMPYDNGHPFVMLRNYDVPDQFYPLGDLESLESLQDELNKTRSQMMNHRKRFARKYLFYERAFGPTGRQALESDEDNVFVPVVDENRPLSEMVTPLPQEAINAELYHWTDQIESDMNTVSGVNEYARGETPDVRRTATEAAIIQDASNARAADKLGVVENTATEVARRLLQIAQQYLDGEHVGRVTGQQGQAVWFQFTADDIAGEFDFAVEAGSTQPMNETFRRQTAVAMMQSLAPFVGTIIDPAVLIHYVLQFGFGIKSPERFLMQQQPMMDPSMQDPNAPPQPGGQPGMQPVPPGGDPTQQPQQGIPQGQQQLPPDLPPELMAAMQGAA